MAVALTKVASGNKNEAAVTSSATDSVSTQAGDILVGCGDATGFGSSGRSATQSGATWSFTTVRSWNNASQAVVVFESTGSAGSGAITVANNDNFADFVWGVYRPTDVAAGPSNVGSLDVASASSLTVTISATSPAMLMSIAYSQNSSADPWTQPSGWTEIDDISAASGYGTMQVCYRTSDVASVLLTPSATCDIDGLVLQFDAAAASGGGQARGAPRAMGRGMGRAMRRQMEKLNGIWRPINKPVWQPITV